MSAGEANLRSILAARSARWDERGALDPRQRQVVSHLTSCRTGALGRRLMACDACGHDERQYHSCRDRHCPRCQRARSQAWFERQREAVLPVTYHHPVFTLPNDLNGWVGAERSGDIDHPLAAIDHLIHRSQPNVLHRAPFQLAAVAGLACCRGSLLSHANRRSDRYPSCSRLSNY